MKHDNVKNILLKSSFGTFIVRGSGSFLLLLQNILLARFLSVEDYGYFIYTYTVINLLTLFAKFGLEATNIKYISKNREFKNHARINGLIIYSVIIVLTISSIMIILLYIFRDDIINIYSIRQYDLLSIGLIAVPFISLIGVFQGTLRGYGIIYMSYLPYNIFLKLFFILSLILSYNYINDYYSIKYFALSSFISLILMIILMLSNININIFSSYSFDELDEWFKNSLPLFLISGVNLLIKKVDILMIGYLINQESSGLYSVASRVVDITLLGLVAINSISAPLISKYYSNNNKYKLKETIRYAAKYSTIFGLVTSILIVLLGEKILLIFGKEYISSYNVLIILVLSQLFNFFVGSVGYLLTMTNKQNVATIILIITGLINIVLNYAFINRYGFIGAAYATGLSNIIWNVSMYIYSLYKMKINSSIIPDKYVLKIK